jgi:hypothetical protein
MGVHADTSGKNVHLINARLGTDLTCECPYLCELVSVLIIRSSNSELRRIYEHLSDSYYN